MNTIETGTPITLTPTVVDWQTVTDFEKAIAEFFGAPYAVAVDSCTHGIELCLRYMKVQHIYCPKQTYISVPMLADKLGIKLKFYDSTWTNGYELANNMEYNLFDAAVHWRANSYNEDSFTCISFQYQKHLSLGRGGMILCPNEETALQLKKMSYDGRLPGIPWREQDIDTMGYHYYMTPETAAEGLRKLPAAIATPTRIWSHKDYPDVSQMRVFKNKE